MNPTDFPITWRHPEDEQKLWSFYGGYMPEPFLPVEQDLAENYFSAAFNQAYQFFRIGESAIRFFNGYYYESLYNTPALSAAEVETLQAKFAPLLQNHLTQGLPADTPFEVWAQAWIAEVKTHLSDLDNLNLEQPSAELLTETLRHYRRIADLHASQFALNVMVMHEFEQFYNDLTLDIPMHQLTHKHDTHAVKGNRYLWQLSQQIQALPEIKELFLQADPATIMPQLATMPTGQPILNALNGYLAEHGKQSDIILRVCYPSWREDPLPVLLNLKAYLSRPERDFEAELQRKQHHHEAALATVRAHLATYPEPARQQFETLLANAQKAAYMLDEHTYWMELSPNYHVRQVLLTFGRVLQQAGSITTPDDIFYLYLTEIDDLIAQPHPVTEQIAQRRADLERFKQLTPLPFIGPFPETAPNNPILDMLFAPYATMGGPSETPNLLLGCAASPGTVIGPVKILSSVREVNKLTAGDILVTSMTTPIWTPIFAHAAGIITDSGGILSHPAIVAREMGIPAVVGTGQASLMLHDGQRVELNGTTGEVKILD